MNEEIENTTKKSSGFRLSKLVWIAIILAFLSVGTILAIKFTNKTESKPVADTASEISIKQYISSLRGDVIRYFEQKQTYEGWKPNSTSTEQVKKLGSEIKTKVLSKNGYMIYAQMPGSKTYFCIDSAGFTGEVNSISLLAKTCK